MIQTITGTVLDAAGAPWASAVVEFQLDDGTGVFRAPGVAGKTDGSGDFSVEVSNNASTSTRCLVRLPDDNIFAFDLAHDDATPAIGTIRSADGSDAVPRLTETGPGTGGGSIPVKASGAEINTGTDDAKFATAKAIADSNIAFLSDITAAIDALIGGAPGALDTLNELAAAMADDAAFATTVTNALAAKLPTASFTDIAVTGKLITNFVAGAGTVAATDTILQAINKIVGNLALKADKLRTVVIDAGATVAPTPADSGKTYRCTNAAATFAPTGSFTAGMYFCVQFSSADGVLDAAAASGAVQGILTDGTYVSSVTSNAYRGHLYYMEFVEADKLAVTGALAP